MNIDELLQSPVVAFLKDALGEESDLHLVGGIVRDLFLGLTPKDWDFATKLTPQEMIFKLDAKNIKYIPTGIRRGTLTIMMDKLPIEVTTFRNPSKEDTYTKTIQEDVPARDFTINALAVSVNSGKLIDMFGGLTDLITGTVRAVGDGDQRFKEDPHRILRMLRFGPAQGRRIEKATLQAAKDNVALLANVSIERIRDEFVKILCAESAGKALRRMQEIGALKIFLPEFEACVGYEQNHYHTLDVWSHILEVIDNSPRDPIVRLAALFHDIAKPIVMKVGDDGVRHFLEHEDKGAAMVQTIFERMKFDTDTTRKVSSLVKLHMRPIDMGGPGVRRLIRDTGELLPSWIALKNSDIKGGHTGDPIKTQARWDKFILEIQKQQQIKVQSKFDSLAIGGDEIIALGVEPGRRIGTILKHLQEVVLDEPEKNTVESLTEIAKSFL